MGSASPTGNRTLSKLEVTEYLLNAIQKNWPDLSVEIVHAQSPENILLLIQTNEAGQLQCSPDNIYASYLQDHFQLDILCGNFVDALHEILEPDLDAPTVLLPAIQNQKWLDEIEEERKQANAQEQSPTAFMPLTADLCVVFVLCRNQTCLFATEDLLAEFVDVELPHLINLAAIEMSIESLRANVSGIRVESTEAGYRVRLDSVFDTSLIMVYEDWEQLLDLQGEPVFALIARDYLMVADSAKPEQVDHLKVLASHAFETAAYPLSAHLFTFKDHQLVLYSQTFH